MKKKFAAALIAIAAGAPASAEGYIGFASEFANAKTEALMFGDDATSSGLGASLVVGAEFQKENFFWGVETNLTMMNATFEEPSGNTCYSGGASGPRMCSADYSIRALAVIGKNFGDIGVYGKFGVSKIHGEFATGSSSQAAGSSSGWTVGLGAKKALSEHLDIFGEVLVDKYHNGDKQPFGKESDNSATSLRFGVLKNF